MNDGLWRVSSLTCAVSMRSIGSVLLLVAALAAACSGGGVPADVAGADEAPADGGGAVTVVAAESTATDEPRGTVSVVDADGAGRASSTPSDPTATTGSTSTTTTGPTSTTTAAPTAPTTTASNATTATTQAASTTTSVVSESPRPAGGTGVIGDGTAASCTSRAVVDAVAAGGTITFDCGPDPITIAMEETAKIINANGPEIVIDGGGLVTLSGQGQRRILYMNTCDQAQGWTTSHCQNQDHPRLTVRNLRFVDGNATGQAVDGGGGGAIFVRGGRLQLDRVTFDRNRCDETGPDVGGAAIRVLSQYQGLPVEVRNSTFRGGVCSNGGAISSIGVSWVIADSTMTGNRAIGRGANPARAGTPGGGSGGAIYLDGNDFTLELRNTTIEANRANEGGGAIFFVSNDRTGRLSIVGSRLLDNPSDGFETDGYPGIFHLGAGPPTITDSTLG